MAQAAHHHFTSDEYLTLEDRHEVEIVRREADGNWSREIAREGEVARLVSIGCELPVAEIYRDRLS